MTALVITLSQEDENFLQNMIATRQDVKTLEEAVLKCIREKSVIGLVSTGDQPPTHLQLEQIKNRTYTPILKPRPTPQFIKEGERLLLVTGNEESIEGMINMISKGIFLP